MKGKYRSGCLPCDTCWKQYSHALHKTIDEHKKKMTFDFERVEIIVGEGESAGYQHFPLIPQCVEKPFFTGWVKFQTICRLLKVNQKFKLDFQRVEIIVGNRENSGYQHFLLFQKY